MTTLKRVDREDLEDGLYVYSWVSSWMGVIRVSGDNIYFPDEVGLLSDYVGKFYGPIELGE